MDPLFRIDNVDMSFTCDDTKDIDKAVLWLTDEKRNDKFKDKFLGDIDVDVSKCTFVFTYNLRQALHPVLLDRMIDVDLSRFNFVEKVNVLKKHVIPKTIERFEMCPGGIKIVSDDRFIKDCVSACPNTPGVYEVKQLIDTICEELEVSYVMDEAIPDVHEMISEYTTAHGSGISNMMYT
jgi:ATP-dependent Lon protease